MSLLWFAEWLDTHDWSTALHESLWAYPIIESTHVLSIMWFVGTIIFVDLRLLGIYMTQTAVSEVTRRVLPWTVSGFVLTFVTGLLLFYAIPVRTYQSVFFRVKVIMLLVAFANILWFHYRLKVHQPVWDTRTKLPGNVRAAAMTSLSCWATVIVMGRMIAYNWFDCDRPQPDWVITLAGCVV